jgi:hypothetical protein
VGGVALAARQAAARCHDGILLMSCFALCVSCRLGLLSISFSLRIDHKMCMSDHDDDDDDD